MARKLMKGNEAAAEAAIRAGMQLYVGYPITPSSEIMEYLSWRMDEVGRIFIQADSEITAINILNGAGAAGGRCMTATSGPGFSLMQEGMSYCASAEIPYVVFNVCRWGRGLGLLTSGQDSYFQCTRGGGEGDYRTIVYAPASIQEMVDMTYESFDVAEKYRIGVVIHSEGCLGQMIEPVELPDFKTREKELDWGLNGKGRFCYKLWMQCPEQTARWRDKLETVQREMQRWESYRTEDAEYVFVAYGLPARVCRNVVDALRKRGEKAGLLRPQIIWPYPVDAFRTLSAGLKGLISVESSDFGQMVEDVALAAKRQGLNVPVYLHAHSFGTPNEKEVIKAYDEIVSGQRKAVY